MDDVDATPDPAEASIQIAPSAPQENSDSPTSPGDIIELGDLIVLKTKDQGIIVGIVYYRDEKLIRIKQNNGSNRLIEFKMDGADFADEELDQLISFDIPRKRAAPSFVEQNNLAAGQLMYVYDADGRVQLDGDTGKEYTYTIITADAEADTIVYADKEEKEQTLNFRFRGIPQSAGFRLIQTKEPTEEDQAPARDAAAAAPEPPSLQEQIEQEEIAESAAADADEGEIDFAIIGTVKMPIMAEIRNIPTNEQVYSDVIQKSDLLTDLMKDLNDEKRRNPLLLRKLRTRMELFNALKEDLIVYDINGIPVGSKPTSIYNLIEMFTLSDVPLGRPVLDILHHLHVLNTPPDSNDDVEFDTPVFDGSIRFRNILDYFKVMKEETRLQKTGSDPAEGDKTMQYWPYLQNLYNNIMRPWQPSYESTTSWSAKQDSEFFRKEIPVITEEDATDEEVSVLEDDDEAAEQSGDTFIRAIQTIKFEEEQRNSKAIQTSVVRLDMSIGRALGPIYRTDDRKKNYELRPGESAPVNNFILFPLGLAPYIGNNRSGMLARDVEYSQRPIMTMKELLRLYKGISNTPTSNSIFALNKNGESLGNITLADYLRDISFTGVGFGSFDFIMRQFGIHRFETNSETRPILLNKIAQTQNKIIDHINKLREALEQLEAKGSKTINDRLIGDPLEAETDAEIAIIEAIRESPLLVAILEAFKNSAPRLANNDIAQVIALMKAYPDFFLAMLGNVPAIVAKEELHAKRMQFAAALDTSNKIKQHELNKGQPPTPNSCPHVAILRDIARIKDANERMTKMVKFVTNKEYIGRRDGNWVDCAKCNQHLLCVHDMLQIKQFTRPREQEVILKEIYMKFNGPLVGGHYQCRNCGQPIAELDFDKNLEFDDEGNPMSGRAVLVDRQAEEAERIEQSLLDPTVKDETINVSFKDPKQNDLYEIAKLISEKVGIQLTREAFIRVIEGVQRHLAKQDSRKKYSQKVERLKAQDPAKAARILDYDAFMSRNLIASCAAHVLIEIQTAIPIYRPRYFLPGCAPAGFGGYPLGGSLENMQGINYLACAIAAIKKGGNPFALLEMVSATRQSAWELTGWQNYQSDKQRIEVIASKILQVVNDHILVDATVQHQLKIKNQYLRDTYGANKDTGDFSKDQIPAGFLPHQALITPEEAAKEPIVAEAVKDKRRLAELYITSAHKLARQTAKLYAGSPYAETVCCEASITDPRAFWKAQTAMPELPPRKLQPNRTSSRLTVHFTPRPLPSLLVDASPSLYYRVFLELCAVDPFKGRKHEFGFSNKCVNCGFQLPASLILVKDYIEKTGISKADAKAETKARQSQLEAAEREANTLFQAQGIEINEQTFRDLLNATHNKNSIEPYVYKKPINIYERLSNLAKFEYAPSKDWGTILSKLVDDVQTLDGMEDTSKEDYAPFFARISNELDAAVKYIQKSLSTKTQAIYHTTRFMDNVYTTDETEFNVSHYLEILLSYFLLPLQRICQFEAETANVYVQSSYDLSVEDISRIKHKILIPADKIRVGLVGSFMDPANKFALAKLQYFVTQLSDITNEFKRFNVRNVPGGNYTLMYLLQYCFFMSLASFLNVNEVPAELESVADEVSYINTSSDLMKLVIIRIFEAYNDQKKSYSPEAIKTALRAAAEKETDRIISRISNLSQNEKDLEMINKVLGTGRYAIGGTKAIYKYSAEQQERETLERMAAGIEDFKQMDAADFAELYGGTQRQQTYAGEAGYDNMQYGEEDF